MKILPGSWVLHDVHVFDHGTVSTVTVAHRALYDIDAQAVALDTGGEHPLVLPHAQVLAVYPQDYPLPEALRSPP
jgi:hypothetical protein